MKLGRLAVSLRDPRELEHDLVALEAIERATTRLVSFAMSNALSLAAEEFDAVLLASRVPTSLGSIQDAANYLGEDLTRMALDQIGMPKVPGGRLFGAIDYKMAGIQFLPDFALEQALFVDSKAEKNAFNNCRIQVTQTSLDIRQTRQGVDVNIPGRVEPVWSTGGHNYLTTTLFVKYHYSDSGSSGALKQITVACLPHRYLQDNYNPDAADGIWNAGPDAPTLGESFRTRLNFRLLEGKATWRVQRLIPGSAWQFKE